MAGRRVCDMMKDFAKDLESATGVVFDAAESTLAAVSPLCRTCECLPVENALWSCDDCHNEWRCFECPMCADTPVCDCCGEDMLWDVEADTPCWVCPGGIEDGGSYKDRTGQFFIGVKIDGEMKTFADCRPEENRNAHPLRPLVGQKRAREETDDGYVSKRRRPMGLGKSGGVRSPTYLCLYKTCENRVDEEGGICEDCAGCETDTEPTFVCIICKFKISHRPGTECRTCLENKCEHCGSYAGPTIRNDCKSCYYPFD